MKWRKKKERTGGHRKKAQYLFIKINAHFETKKIIIFIFNVIF
jgi:hypothetical protein